jgi:hydrogenase nickel incorporation protein HypB
MRATCGCSGHHHVHFHGHSHSHEVDHARVVKVERELLAKNAHLAGHNRAALTAQRITVFHLIGSPGAGKTALLEATVRRLTSEMELAVLEGDQATDRDRDARRIESAGCRALPINTGTGCRLDASMIANALKKVAPHRDRVVFVENVGNLACPALCDLGERAKVVVMSVTEGEDEPIKYPHIFEAADLFVLNKIDLQPLVQLDVMRCFEFAKQVNPKIRTMRVSARTGQGIDTFCDWIRTEVRS